jgi:hypothetical protein
MAKKKVILKKVKPPAKAVKKSAKSAKPAAKKPLAKSAKPTKKALARPAPAAPVKKVVAPDEPTLGRPLVTQEEKLYMLFHEDYEARQVFEFLRVETVAELEKLSPEEIIKVLTAPVRRTVQRIRQRLAEKNRSLMGDEEFTRQHKAKLQ